MGNICKVCYSFQDVLQDSEIKRSHIIGGKNSLLICRDCFNSNIKIPPSNAQEKQGQMGAAKTRKLQVEVQISNKKDRKQLKMSK